MTKPKLALFDLDSTLSDSTARFDRFEKEYGGRDNIDWTAYALACSDDPPTQTVALAKLLVSLGLKVGGVSFRPEVARGVSVAWAAQQGVEFEVLKLLQDEPDDSRVVSFKVDSVREVMDDYEVVLFVEDQHRIAKAVQEELGVPCMVVSSYAPSFRELSF